MVGPTGRQVEEKSGEGRGEEQRERAKNAGAETAGIDRATARAINGSMVLGMYYAPNNYERALNPQIEKLRGSTGSHVVLYFVHRLGACLERRIING